MSANLEVHENTPHSVAIFLLTQIIKNCNFVPAMAKPKQVQPMLKRVILEPNEKENAILRAGMEKHGLIKAVDVLRMALRRFAEVEGLPNVG
jgi:hypothetical protein